MKNLIEFKSWLFIGMVAGFFGGVLDGFLGPRFSKYIYFAVGFLFAVLLFVAE